MASQRRTMIKSYPSYLLHLADNALILGHRNSEWCGHGPILEQDIALTNIALDLIGQSRYFFQYAAELMGGNASEDSLAYLRDERAYLNFLMLELPKGDWGMTLTRQFLFSHYQRLLYQALISSSDERISAIAEKALKEVSYHARWSSEWMIRLGDGTEESHRRVQDSLNDLWPYTGEFFMDEPGDAALADSGISVLPSSLKEAWIGAIVPVLNEAGLNIPTGTWQHSGGRKGSHTEHLGYILAEMQFLQRAHPGADW
jgi:ring-1,2-phenylacetyl-CoA epoxidase subunit PaaC